MVSCDGVRHNAVNNLLLCVVSAGIGVRVGAKWKQRQPIVPTANHTTVTLHDVKSVLSVLA